MNAEKITPGIPLAILTVCFLMLTASVNGQILSQYEKALSSDISNQASSGLMETFSFQFEETPFKKALDQVAEKGSLSVLVNHKLFDQEHTVTLRLENVTLREAFERIVAEANLDFMDAGNGYVIIIPKTEKQKVEIQEEIITGTVIDGVTGESLPGVNILIKGSSTGTSTDEYGDYSITVSSLQDTLVLSYVGYITEEVPIDGRSQIDILLQPQAIEGQELVVVGYGTQSRETITGSISSVNESDFNTGQINDPLALISGKVAGLTISSPNEGDPNATSDYSLRGPATLQGNSQPLIVIDGIPGANLQAVDPANISSIEVLKDGAAAAIYGSRATAGVILVSTKEGHAGDTRIDYSGSVSTDLVSNRYNMLDAQQYRQVAEEYNFALYDEGVNTDWFDEVTRTPASHSHNLSLSGGNANTTYYTSLSYRNSQGLDLISKREFVNGSVRLNTKALDDRLDFTINLKSSQDDRNFSSRGALAQAIRMFPTFPVKNQDGSYFEEPNIQFGLQWNPVANMMLNANNSEDERLLGSANLSYQLSNNLEASLSYSLIRDSFLSSFYSSNNDFFQERDGLGGQASRSENRATSKDFGANLTYLISLDDHNFDVLAGYSYQNIFNEGFNAGNNDFSTDAFGYYNLGAGSALNNLDPNVNRGGVYLGSYADERSLESFFGRVIYDYQQRYMLNVSIRREGASVLGADNKWGTFSGISAGWRLSSETFMEDVTFVKNLMLRAGYGVTGNQQSLSPYQSLATIGPFYNGTNNAFYGEPGNSEWIQSYGPTSNSNPALRWEIKKELNIGLEFSVFENSWLRGSFDYYNRNIENLVGNYSAQLPSQIFPNIFANAGEMNNRGFELSLNAHLIRSNNFSWNTSFTGAYNRNEIVSISSEQFQGTAQNITYIEEGRSAQRLAPGQPVAAFYGRVFAGFTDDGDWLFENSAGEAVSPSEIGADDFAYLGNSIPRYNLALTNTFNYKNFDASFMIKSALDFNAVNAKRLHYENLNYFTRNNLFESVLKNPITAEPTFSSYYIEKGDYLKLKNMTIGYTIPTANIQSVQNIRIYATGTNLATFTAFSGDDPELSINWEPSESETSNGPGVEGLYDYFPSTTRFEIGVNISF